jgi:hypothetical protein
VILPDFVQKEKVEIGLFQVFHKFTAPRTTNRRLLSVRQNGHRPLSEKMRPGDSTQNLTNDSILPCGDTGNNKSRNNKFLAEWRTGIILNNAIPPFSRKNNKRS